MKRMGVISSVLVLFLVVSTASADVITFESYAPGQYVNIGAGAVTFGNFMSVDYTNTTLAANGNYDVVLDGTYNTQDILIQNLMGVNAGAFGYFSLSGLALGTMADSLTLEITGYTASEEVYATIDLTGGTMNYYGLNGFDGVTMVRFAPVGGGTFYVDDMTINQSALPYSPVPAPGASLLGGLGISLVGWLRRRNSI